MDDTTKKELQSAVFERLVLHLRERKDVQKAFAEIVYPNGIEKRLKKRE